LVWILKIKDKTIFQFEQANIKVSGIFSRNLTKGVLEV